MTLYSLNTVESLVAEALLSDVFQNVLHRIELRVVRWKEDQRHVVGHTERIGFMPSRASMTMRMNSSGWRLLTSRKKIDMACSLTGGKINESIVPS